ncbi:MAG: cytochrome c biogenesis protein ResB, partial [Chloroflexota bacterium]
MTQKVESRPLPPATGPASGSVESRSLMDYVDTALEWLWHFISSMRVAMVIMLVIAVLGVLGSLFMQMPAAMQGDAQAKAQWLDSVRPKYGGWTNVLDTLQLFNIFNSIYFNLLIGALTVSLIACSVHRFPGMVRTATKPRVDVGPAFFEHAPQHEAIVARRPLEETTQIASGVLRKHGYRVLQVEDDVVHVYADKHRWLSFSGLIGHLALVLVLAGALVGGKFGYRDRNGCGWTGVDLLD